MTTARVFVAVFSGPEENNRHGSMQLQEWRPASIRYRISEMPINERRTEPLPPYRSRSTAVTVFGAASCDLRVIRYTLQRRAVLADGVNVLLFAVLIVLQVVIPIFAYVRERGTTDDRLPIPEPPLMAVVHRLGFYFPNIIIFDEVIALREEMNPELLFTKLST